MARHTFSSGKGAPRSGDHDYHQLGIWSQDHTLPGEAATNHLGVSAKRESSRFPLEIDIFTLSRSNLIYVFCAPDWHQAVSSSTKFKRWI